MRKGMAFRNQKVSRSPLRDLNPARQLLLLALLLCVASAVAQDAEQYGECSQYERESYLQLLRQKLQSNWRVPIRHRQRACTVKIVQNFRAEVLNAGVEDCSDDPALIKSIEDAVYLSSPLPKPANPACFEKTVSVRMVPKPN